ncbi:MAG: RNA polymerase sigma factor, partial [Isosphaeraceae bacterium]
RVSARARAAAIRRRVRERRAVADADAVASAGNCTDSAAGPAGLAERRESAAAVHEEVVRLPENYRAPIVLCYFEGLTHDEAAARLNWPVGTVRSRLARARDRLRGRLERRGFAVPSAVGPMALFFDAAGDSAKMTFVRPLPQAHLPVPLTRAAVRLAAGPTAPAGSWPSASIVLADGVLQTMLIRKLTIVACVLATLGIGTGAGISLVRRTPAQEAPAARPSPARARPVAVAEPTVPDIDPKLKELIEAARKRVEVQKAYYEEGRMTLDRFIQGLVDLCDVELLAATTDAERSAVFQRKIDRLKEIEEREKGEVAVGRGTEANIAESRQARLRAEFDLKVRQKEQAEKAALLHRIAELERKVAESQNERGGGRQP